ncbi:hypothetical protein PENSPDRAFT_651427 [Peniophora sp. CONT]|nr:hypothetical protein PENSPDRAFT_651427 [Peniophora sp. CONT]
MSSYEPKPGQYDERLLAEAPQTTRAAKQEGYNVDLLNQPHPAGSSSSLQEPTAAQPVNPNRNAYTPPATAASDAPQLYTTHKTPWYRTTRGILILAIAALVIIGAVVGGAVGGTVGKHKNNNNLAVPGNSSSSASSSATSSASDNGGVGQGTGAASSTAAGLGEASASASTPTASSSTTSGSAGAPAPASATSQSGTPAPSAAAGDGTNSATPQRRRSGKRV